MLWFVSDSNLKEDLEAFDALQKDSDRGAAIIAASFVEELLEEKIKHLMRDDAEAKKELTEIFRSSGPLGSFSAKIQFGFLMRLYGTKAYKELVIIKDVRNKFAHTVNHLNFKTQAICDKVKNLKLVEGYIQPKMTLPKLKGTPFIHYPPDHLSELAKLDDPRTRFMETCGIFLAHFQSGHENLFLPIFGDDRSPWPEKLRQLLSSVVKDRDASVPTNPRRPFMK